MWHSFCALPHLLLFDDSIRSVLPVYIRAGSHLLRMGLFLVKQVMVQGLRSSISCYFTFMGFCFWRPNLSRGPTLFWVPPPHWGRGQEPSHCLTSVRVSSLQGARVTLETQEPAGSRWNECVGWETLSTSHGYWSRKDSSLIQAMVLCEPSSQAQFVPCGHYFTPILAKNRKASARGQCGIILGDQHQGRLCASERLHSQCQSLLARPGPQHALLRLPGFTWVDSTFHPPLLPLFSFSFSPDSLLLSLSLPSFFSIFSEIQILWKIFSTQNLLLVNISRAFLQRGLFFAKLNRYVTPILNSFIIDIFVVIHICIPFSS